MYGLPSADDPQTAHESRKLPCSSDSQLVVSGRPSHEAKGGPRCSEVVYPACSSTTFLTSSTLPFHKVIPDTVR